MAENKNAQQVREITDKLEQGIKELFESERFKEYLRTMSKFYNYSFNNTLLIAMQKPEATLVAGYTAWQRNFDRHVMKGEKGIRILAPAPYKTQMEMEKIDPKTQKPVLDADGKPVTEMVEVMRPAFKVVSVFDVSQTEGKELPDIVVDELKGTVENYTAFFEALRQISPVPIGFEDISGGAKGYYHLEDRRIAIQEGMSEIQTVKTAIHEIAHAKLHTSISRNLSRSGSWLWSVKAAPRMTTGQVLKVKLTHWLLRKQMTGGMWMKTGLSGGLRSQKTSPKSKHRKKTATPRRLRQRALPTRSVNGMASKPLIIPSDTLPVGPPIRRQRS